MQGGLAVRLATVGSLSPYRHSIKEFSPAETHDTLKNLK